MICEERIQWHAQHYVLTGRLTIRCARLYGPFERLTFGGCLEGGKNATGGRLKGRRRKEEVLQERCEEQDYTPLSPPRTPPGRTTHTTRVHLKRILKSRATWAVKHHKDCLRILLGRRINIGLLGTKSLSPTDAIQVDTASRVTTANKFLFSSSPPMIHADEDDAGTGDLMGNISNFCRGNILGSSARSAKLARYLSPIILTGMLHWPSRTTGEYGVRWQHRNLLSQLMLPGRVHQSFPSFRPKFCNVYLFPQRRVASLE